MHPKNYDKSKDIDNCPECKGIGEISSETCKFCGGSGKVIIHSHEHSHNYMNHDHPHPHDHSHHPGEKFFHDHRHQERSLSGSTEKASVTKKQELCEKIIELYPDIGLCGIDVVVDFDRAYKKWVVNLKEGGRKRKTYLDDEDVQLCMRGKQCVSLGMEIAQLAG
jgi:hypothetical protein